MKIDCGDLLTVIIGVLSFFGAVKAAKAAYSSSDAAIKLVAPPSMGHIKIEI